MQIIDRTNQTAGIHQTRNHRNIFSRGDRAARRPVNSINAIMLHQTSFLSSSVERFDYIIANYVVMQDGRVLFVRPLDAALNSIGTNQHAIDIEFVGDYPDASALRRGPVSIAPPIRQIKAGRDLVRHLKGQHGIGIIHGHVQFTAKNCPGPQLWYNVGEWAIRNGFRGADRGRGIPSQWRAASLELLP